MLHSILAKWSGLWMGREVKWSRVCMGLSVRLGLMLSDSSFWNIDFSTSRGFLCLKNKLPYDNQYKLKTRKAILYIMLSEVLGFSVTYSRTTFPPQFMSQPFISKRNPLFTSSEKWKTDMDLILFKENKRNVPFLAYHICRVNIMINVCIKWLSTEVWDPADLDLNLDSDFYYWWHWVCSFTSLSFIHKVWMIIVPNSQIPLRMQGKN